MVGDPSQHSQRAFKPKKQLCLKKPSASNGKKVQSQREPNRKVRIDTVSLPVNKVVKSERQYSVVKHEKECRPLKIDKSQTSSNNQVRKEKIVIDLISDDESEISKLDPQNVNIQVQEQSITSNETHNDFKQSIPAFSVPIVQNSCNSTLNALSDIGKINHKAQQEPVLGQDCLLQNDLTDFMSDEWQNGWFLDNTRANDQNAQDFNVRQECDFDDSGIQINKSPNAFRFHDGSTSIEAETPITIDSPDEVNNLITPKDTEKVVTQVMSVEKEHDIVVDNTNDDQDHPLQANMVMQSSEQVASTINFWQMLFQSNQSNAENANNSIQSARTHIYIPEMPIDPISEKQLGKRKADKALGITTLPCVQSIQNATVASTTISYDDENDLFAGIPHLPTELPTTCHRCRNKDHELKMKCRMHEGPKPCGLYFCKICCLELGDEEFQPYLEMYCCARCDRRCDCNHCKEKRRKTSKKSSKNRYTANKKPRRTGHGFKTVTQAYRDSVASFTARKKLPDMVVNSGSSLLSSVEDFEEETKERESEKGAEKPVSGSREAFVDNMAQYEYGFNSSWGKTANRRHLSDNSSECIRRYNESSESEDGRATPASSVASLRVSMDPGSPWHNQS